MQEQQYKELKGQNKFCKELARRLFNDIETAEAWGDNGYKYIQGCSRMTDDIKRLRRELNTLSKLLN